MELLDYRGSAIPLGEIRGTQKGIYVRNMDVKINELYTRDVDWGIFLENCKPRKNASMASRGGPLLDQPKLGD